MEPELCGPTEANTAVFAGRSTDTVLLAWPKGYTPLVVMRWETAGRVSVLAQAKKRSGAARRSERGGFMDGGVGRAAARQRARGEGAGQAGFGGGQSGFTGGEPKET